MVAAWREGYVKALWNKWEVPSSAGRETVYAAKGLDGPINAGESVEDTEDFVDYKENKKIAHVYLTLTFIIDYLTLKKYVFIMKSALAKRY
jgi:hypothetical protein